MVHLEIMENTMINLWSLLELFQSIKIKILIFTNFIKILKDMLRKNITVINRKNITKSHKKWVIKIPKIMLMLWDVNMPIVNIS